MSTFQGTTEELNSLISEFDGLSVIGLGSTTCAPCRKLKQLLPGIAKEFPAVQFINIEIDEKPEFRDFSNITAVPVVHFVKGLKDDSTLNIIDSILGLKVSELKSKLAQYT